MSPGDAVTALPPQIHFSVCWHSLGPKISLGPGCDVHLALKVSPPRIWPQSKAKLWAERWWFWGEGDTQDRENIILT